MQDRLTIAFVLYFMYAKTVVAHSWLECTNYDAKSYDYSEIGNYDRALCKGYPRNFKQQYDKGFGVDTNYQWSNNDCSRDQFNPSDYTDEIPMATYVAGEIIYLAHPAKLNVADVCTNSLIPSKSVKLYITSYSFEDIKNTNDSKLMNSMTDTFDVELQVEGGDHVDGSIDHLGYQRCYDFCNNMDKALCLTGWKIPKTLSSGIHSFKWVSEMVSGKYYTSCFDAQIISQDNIIDIQDESHNSDSEDMDDIILLSDTKNFRTVDTINLNDSVEQVSTDLALPLDNLTQYLIKLISVLNHDNRI